MKSGSTLDLFYNNNKKLLFSNKIVVYLPPIFVLWRNSIIMMFPLQV